MNKISGVIITYNEEKFIENCILSIKDVVDEIVVLDSYSNDKTEEICKKYNVKFFQNEFSGFTTQKNLASEKAENDFVLSLDADEELSEELKSEVLKLKNNDFIFDGYSFNRLNNYCGKWIRHSNWYPDNKIRLYNRLKGKWVGENNIHEIIKLKANTKQGNIKGDLLHWAYQSNEEHYLKINKYAKIAAENYVKNNKKRVSFFKIFINPFWKFFNNYFIKKGFLDGYYGFVICRFASISTFLKYIMIKELQNKQDNEDRF